MPFHNRLLFLRQNVQFFYSSVPTRTGTSMLLQRIYNYNSCFTFPFC
uniref:Uncharacterized protein n=1 Tax=Arundo donax TaxID=35708 RepID=A0A0A9FXS0_ARUDO